MAQTPAFTEADRAAVAAAVARAEQATAGEIVPITADSSDSYADVALVWSAGAAFLALSVVAAFQPFCFGLIARLTGEWNAEWRPRGVLELALLIATLKFAGMWLLQLWRPLRLWLVPGAIKHTRVRAAAVRLFRVAAEGRTAGSTGVLIYLSRAERRAEIVVEPGIAAAVDPTEWGAAMAALLGEVRAGRAGAGLAAAIAQVGTVLAAHCPRRDDDTNELPDRLIEV